MSKTARLKALVTATLGVLVAYGLITPGKQQAWEALATAVLVIYAAAGIDPAKRG